MPPELTPRDGAKLPPKQERLPPHEKALMEEIDKMAKDEAQAMTVLANSALRTADAAEDTADLLDDVKAIMVKICMKFGIDLPARVQKAIDAGEYSPDEIEEEGGDGDGEDDAGTEVH